MKMNNLAIRSKLMETGKAYYWLAGIMGISDNTLFRRLREELPADEQNRILKLIEDHIQKEGAKNE